MQASAPAPVGPSPLAMEATALQELGSSEAVAQTADVPSPAAKFGGNGVATEAAPELTFDDLPIPPSDAMFEAISQLRQSLLEEELPAYVREFERLAAAEDILVGLLPEEELARRKAEIEEGRRKEAEAAAQLYERRKAHLAALEKAARQRVLAERRAADAAARAARHDVTRIVQAEEAKVKGVFRKVLSAMHGKLQQYGAVVSARYGGLRPGRNMGVALKLEFRSLPQPIEFRLHKLRAVKSKLPNGAYVLQVTLYDRLGGSPLVWSKLGLSGGGGGGGGGGDASRPSATTPLRHRGRYHDTELPVHQCIYATAPPADALAPNHTYVFELYQLGSKAHPLDRVVAWSALPVADIDLHPVTGKFRLPLLRGEMNAAVDRYSVLERAIAADLDAWLCNMYLEVVRLPREHWAVAPATSATKATAAAAGGLMSPTAVASTTAATAGRSTALSLRPTLKRVRRREFEVEVAYTSQLLRIRGEYRAPVGVPGSGGGHGSSSSSSGGAVAMTGAALRGADAALLIRDGASNPADYDYDEEDDDEDGDADGKRKKKQKKGSSDGVGDEDDEESDIEWERAGDREGDDEYTGGPGVVSDRVTAAMLKSPTAAAQTGKSAATGAKGAAAATKTPKAANNTSGSGSGSGSGLNSRTSTGNSAQTPLSPLAPLAARNPKSPNAAATATGSAAATTTTTTALTAAAASKVAGAFAAEMRETARGREQLLGSPLASPGGGKDTDGAGAGAGEGIGGAGASAGASAGAPHGTYSHYSYAINRQELKGLTGARLSETSRKLRFFWSEVAMDLRKWPAAGAWTLDWWMQLLLLGVALWLRMYIHYLGQYLFLRSLRIPVYAFTPDWLTARVRYVAAPLPIEVETGVVVLGPIAVLGAFAAMCGVSWLWQRILGSFPEIPSRFFSFFGVVTVLDAALIAAVDAGLGRYDCEARFAACAENVVADACGCVEGDAWKLLRRFQQAEGSGVVGIILTAFLYLVLALLALLLLYVHTLHLHLNGRMIDTFRRLNAPSSHFFLPGDFEVSAAELVSVIEKAHLWRGAKGATRRVAVAEYALTDPSYPRFKAVTTHLIIYTADLAGGRELYRHFLRGPDGVITELFGKATELAALGGPVAGPGSPGGSKQQSALAQVLQMDDSQQGNALQRFFQQGW